MSAKSTYGLQIANLGLRGLTLASKFLLIFILALYLDPKELGLYGLIVATIGYGMYPLGLEFYTYNIRELLSVDNKKKGSLLKNQLALHLKLYILFLPFFCGIFIFKLLPVNLIWHFFIILIFEHLNQELGRLMIVLSKQLAATICLFVRQGLWVLVLIGYMYFDESARNLNMVLIFWIIGSSVSLAMASYTILTIRMAGWDHEIDWKWIRKGIKVSAPFLIGSLALNAISTIDRYWLSHLQGKEILAAYIFFMSLSASLLSFLDAAIFSFSYPKLISSVAAEDRESFLNNFKKMIIQTMFLISFFCVCSLALIGFIVNWIGNEIYRDNKSLFYIALASISIHCFSYVYHYALYAYKRDVAIISGHVSMFIVFILTGFLLSFWNTLYAIPVAVLVSYIFLFFWKYVAYVMCERKLIHIKFHEDNIRVRR